MFLQGGPASYPHSPAHLSSLPTLHTHQSKVVVGWPSKSVGATHFLWVPLSFYGCHLRSVGATHFLWVPHTFYGCHLCSVGATHFQRMPLSLSAGAILFLWVPLTFFNDFAENSIFNKEEYSGSGWQGSNSSLLSSPVKITHFVKLLNTCEISS